MDFKSILTKLDGMEKPEATPAAPTLVKAPKLNESAELRILAGQSTLIGEATKILAESEMKVGDKKPSSSGGTIEKTKTGLKHTAGNRYSGKEAEKEEKSKKVDEVFDKDSKVGDTKTTSKGGTATKTKTGMVHKAGPGVYGGSEKETDPLDKIKGPKGKKGKTEESIDLEEFYEEFDKLVEAKKKPSAGMTKKEKSAVAKKAKAGDDIGKPGKGFAKVEKAAKKGGAKDPKAVAAAAMWKNAAKNEAVEEAAKPDFLDMDKDGDKKEPMKKAVADKKKAPFGKKTVKESVEQKLTFKDMVRLVQESGGQQQIDALDAELFAWAQRVAANKFEESAKQEIYAGLVYERMGGVFQMYDVLAEAK